jgi:hypothetical protein
MGVVRRFAVSGLDEAAGKTGRPRGLAVGAIDKTGQVKIILLRARDDRRTEC